MHISHDLREDFGLEQASFKGLQGAIALHNSFNASGFFVLSAPLETPLLPLSPWLPHNTSLGSNMAQNQFGPRTASRPVHRKAPANSLERHGNPLRQLPIGLLVLMLDICSSQLLVQRTSGTSSGGRQPAAAKISCCTTASARCRATFSSSWRDFVP